MVLFVLCGSILGKLYYVWKNVFYFPFCYYCCSFLRVESKKEYNGLFSAKIGLTLREIVYWVQCVYYPMITMK